MTSFSQDFKSIIRGETSLESIEGDLPSPDNEISDEFIMETRQDREEVTELSDISKELEQESDYLDASAVAVGQVNSVTLTTPNIQPAETDAYVPTANLALENAERILGTTLPRLRAEPNGRIETESMEGMISWVKQAVVAFAEATKRFASRVMLSFSRMRSSVESLKSRSSKVRQKMTARKGSGGKPIRLNSDYLAELIKGDGYSPTLSEDLIEFSKFVSEFTSLVDEYHGRVAKLIKETIMEVISGEVSERFFNIENADLVKQADALILKQPKLLLGNTRFGKEGRRITQILDYSLLTESPDANVLVKHLDAPKSLTNEEIIKLLGTIDQVIADQQSLVEDVSKRISQTFSNCNAMVDRLSKSIEINQTTGEINEFDFDASFDEASLLRIENELVAELGRVCTKIHSYEGWLFGTVSAALALVEESVFQD